MSGYREAAGYLQSFVDYERIKRYAYKKTFGLKRIKNLLRLAGSPQKDIRFIHIAGSKGKGSTCAFVAYILREAGFRVGLYTSPHLADFRERIRILKPSRKSSTASFEGAIPMKEVVRLVDILKPAIEKSGRPSFFEVYTALALLYFRDERVDFAVMETGMGGRLDATNAVKGMVCGITPISYEHTRYLGDTLAAIAGEKCGIIKRKSVVVSSPQEREAERVIKNRCSRMQARLYSLGRDIKYAGPGSNFSVRGIRNKYAGLKINLLGAHQVVNAAQAVGIVEVLGSYGFKVSVDCVKKGLYNTIWPGRLEILCRRPVIAVDGAQNAASAAALKKAVRDNFKYRKLILVFGVSQDKDITGMAKQFSGMAHKIILTRADNPRAVRPQELAGVFKYGDRDKIILTADVKEAKAVALNTAGPRDLILVTGSLFVVGEFRDAYGRF
jgi:dihydrofolate synthase/folylpolyglutamate synthase